MALAAPFPAARPASRPVRRPRPAAASSSLRLTRRGRVVIALASILMLFGVTVVSGAFTADAGSSAAEQGRATGVVVVQAGESLWQIAQAIAPQADPRETVTTIRELNGLGDTTVVPGQSIVVPVVSVSAAGAPGA